MTLAAQIRGREAHGFREIQRGRIIAAPAPRLTFSDRAEGFDIHLLGRGWPDPQFDNVLLEDEEQWVHLRRERHGATTQDTAAAAGRREPTR